MTDYRETDIGNAHRFLDQHGDNVVFVKGLGWHVWDGKRWEFNEEKARLMAQQTAEDIFDEWKGLGEDDKRKRLSWAYKSGTSPRITAMLTEAAPRIGKYPSDLDSDPWLLNLTSGTVDLRTSDLRRHSRDDFITMLAPVKFDPSADAPKWRKFLDRICPDAGVHDFLQRWLGYSLTGLTDEQKFCVFYGTGANGKTTLNEAVRAVMGDYAQTIDCEILLHRERNTGASPELARLAGSRLLFASEPDVGRRFSESLIKSLTGGDKITARHLYQAPIEFTPKFKLMVAGNHRPAVKGNDEGIWRRVLLVPFTEMIPPSERDPALLAKLKKEAPGILLWLIEGCRNWQKLGGLNEPEAVKSATESYREENDILGPFLDERTEKDPQASVKVSDLYRAFQDWCEENGLRPANGTAFGRMLTERGFEKKKTGVVYRKGLTLKEEYSQTVQHDLSLVNN